jgi:indole-3-glycerol phosphate synthase
MCNLRDLHRFQRLLWAREAVVFLVEESGVHSPEDAQRMVQAGRCGCPAGENGADGGDPEAGEINRLG